MLWIAIHAVDKMHAGKDDSSVLYIPACPLTEANAEYLVRQREAFFEGTFPYLPLTGTKKMSLPTRPRRNARPRLPFRRGRKPASRPLDARLCDAEYRRRGPACDGAYEVRCRSEGVA